MRRLEGLVSHRVGRTVPLSVTFRTPDLALRPPSRAGEKALNAPPLGSSCPPLPFLPWLTSERARSWVDFRGHRWPLKGPIFPPFQAHNDRPIWRAGTDGSESVRKRHISPHRMHDNRVSARIALSTVTMQYGCGHLRHTVGTTATRRERRGSKVECPPGTAFSQEGVGRALRARPSEGPPRCARGMSQAPEVLSFPCDRFPWCPRLLAGC